MSVAPAPAIPPQAPQPQVVPARPRRLGNGSIWIGSILAITMIAGALYWQRRSASNQPPVPAAGAIRTATVKTGAVETTIRLSGATAAENFVSLMTPQLRFSRSDRSRDTSAAAPAAAAAATTAPASTNSTASSAAAPGAPSAFQSATNRFGGTLRGSAPASSSSGSSASAPAASSAMGSGGLGSAADAGGIGGGGGGGGGGNDSTLILQDV